MVESMPREHAAHTNINLLNTQDETLVKQNLLLMRFHTARNLSKCICICS